MEKVEISRAEKEYYENYCRRCGRHYCLNCVDFHKVEIEVIEKIRHDNPNLPDENINWKDEEVCPWCYNQLCDLKNKQDPRKCNPKDS